MSKETIEKNHKNILQPAFTETGKALQPDVALRRFIAHTDKLIAIDESHFGEEVASDFMAMGEAANAIIDASIHLDPSNIDTSEGMAIVSASAAIILLRSINKQRVGKEIEFNKSLKMLLCYENNLENKEHGETRDQRREHAIKELGNDMRKSGLQFTNLPKKDQKFDTEHYLRLAKRRALDKPVTARAVQKCREFMVAPIDHKMHISGQALSRINYAGEKYTKYAGKVISNMLSNIVPRNFASVFKTTFKGYQSGVGLKSHFKDHIVEQEGRVNSVAEELPCVKVSKGNHNKKQSGEAIGFEPLAPDQLKSVQLTKIKQTGVRISQEQRDDIQNILSDAERHLHNAKRARFSLYLQSAFQVAQIGGAVSKVFERNYASIGMNVYSFVAAMGPLKGFADELIAEKAKANSKLAKHAEHIGHILNMHRQDVASLNDGDKETPASSSQEQEPS